MNNKGKVESGNTLSENERVGRLSIITDYTYALDILDRYD